MQRSVGLLQSGKACANVDLCAIKILSWMFRTSSFFFFKDCPAKRVGLCSFLETVFLLNLIKEGNVVYGMLMLARRSKRMDVV